ncbi:MAG: type II secretion system protein GspK [Proteobacteria bacterium]|jgi:general secretion pathway protein K|nr:type II secretion system protein GspK [Pseudomonadota bacterium]NLN62789.1 general secretion pathway protein GspK [Myxococcales bacterium]
MKRNADKKRLQRGMALLVVLITLTILSAMTVEFIETNEVYLAAAFQHRDGVQAEYLARSGVNLSRLLLSLQGTPVLQSIGSYPFWKFADMLLDPFLVPIGDDGQPLDDDEQRGGLEREMANINFSTAEGLGLKEGQSFSVTIVDEESKFNLNVGTLTQPARRDATLASLMTLVESPIYDELFRHTPEGDSIEREDVIGEIFDWSDPDQDKLGGAAGEENYYAHLTPSYRRKNAPFDSLQELFLLHGIGDDFWSAFVEPNPENPDSRVMTVWGTGKVNINTANSQVLLATLCQLAKDEATGQNPCLDLTTQWNVMFLLQQFLTIRTFIPAEDVGSFLNMISDPSSDPMLAMMMAMSGEVALVGLPMSRQAKNEARTFLATQSEVFSIYAEGEVGNAVKRIHAVVHANPRDPDMLDPQKKIMLAGGKVLYWRME